MWGRTQRVECPSHGKDHLTDLSACKLTHDLQDTLNCCSTFRVSKMRIFPAQEDTLCLKYTLCPPFVSAPTSPPLPCPPLSYPLFHSLPLLSSPFPCLLLLSARHILSHLISFQKNSTYEYYLGLEHTETHPKRQHRDQVGLAWCRRVNGAGVRKAQ